ncbi:MAG: response regulator [Kofleriaceae bacterium]|jgi:DNA-binding response OmpR family regulator|nr:response regulator [Kofleriaceae bacterium]MBP9165748.1 response regulator [Kofleriaceae bacterium]MBP9857897.1 response regulator [Kofleriaceae bacterium]
MRRRAARIVISLDVVVHHDGAVLHAASQDLTPFGLFLRLDPPLPVGAEVELAIAPGGRPARGRARVVHALGAADATALGRRPGNGLVVLPEADGGLAAALLAIVEASPQVAAPRDELVALVADGSTRLLERMSTALDAAGFRVMTAASGVEALAAVGRARPDVIVAARDLPVLDGLALLDELGRSPELASVPVMIIAEHATDLARLEAFQRGAQDYVPKPFTALEIILRARRLARLAQRDPERVLLRGAVTAVGLPALLTMMELERKTGVLTMTRDELVAWLSFVDGRLVRVRTSDHRGDSRAALLRVLDWERGHFELVAGGADIEPDLTESVTHLLLEHARVRDERGRRSPEA